VRKKLEKNNALTNKDFKDFFNTVSDPENYPRIQTLLDEYPKERNALVAYIKKTYKSVLKAAELVYNKEDDNNNNVLTLVKRCSGKLPKKVHERKLYSVPPKNSEKDKYNNTDKNTNNENPRKKRKVNTSTNNN
jgi:hypothetical protein